MANRLTGTFLPTAASLTRLCTYILEEKRFPDIMPNARLF